MLFLLLLARDMPTTDFGAWPAVDVDYFDFV